MDVGTARALFGKQFIGPEELARIAPKLGIAVPAHVPEIHFSEDMLKEHARDFLLVLGVSSMADGMPLTINNLRSFLGTDSAVREPCMYNQDWYINEDFASKTALESRWHLIRKNVLEDARAKRPEDIEMNFAGGEHFPAAVTCTFIFFAYWFLSGGEKLWKHDFLWCLDRDHNNDRIYVGRYEDPTGVNKNGFNIHRHLALRAAYSAAPEL